MVIDLIVFRSEIHDLSSVTDTRKELFENIRLFSKLNIIDYKDYFSQNREEDLSEEVRLTVCFIATGGTENIFSAHCAELSSPIILLSDGYHNSFAASFEIATWLEQNGISHELINVPLEYKNLDYLAFRLSCLQVRHILNGMSHHFRSLGDNVEESRDSYELSVLYSREDIKNYLSGSIIGLIGGESSWLISSHIDREAVSRRFGVKFIDIDICELSDLYLSKERPANSSDLDDAVRMYQSLKEICVKYSLTAMTIKCFDLLELCHTTACYALAKLNDEGIVSGCEGDIPTLWTMMMVRAITGKSSFMANPSSSSLEEKSVDFAHCTVPFSLTESVTFPSHFESGIGIGVAGVLPLGPYSLIKIGGKELTKLFYCNGKVLCNTSVEQRCRTQVRFVFQSDDFNKFLDNRMGNHIVLAQGGWI